ncbi:MAG TPA: RidA family protein [Chloroflexota bacterium]|jgi:enamine deaminase RidA (YjgF/YER057c/UK114 family)|nr:RidA family protein [Chloroflexota bacterium]
MSKVQDRLTEVGLTIPEVPAPVAAYVPAMRTGDLVFTAGQIPRVAGVLVTPGRVGAETSRDEARAASRQAALQAIAAVGSVVDDLDDVQQVVKVTVFVKSAPGFTDQPFVADGASELLQTAFADAGRHARSAVGVAELPLGSCVEVEVIVEVAHV